MSPETLKKKITHSFRDYDLEFEQSLKESKIIHLGEFLKSPEQNNVSKKKKDIAEYIKKDQAKWSDAKKASLDAVKPYLFKSDEILDVYLEKTIDVVAPIASLSIASAGVGFEQIIPDNITGTVYEYPMLLEYDGSIHPALGLLMVAKLLGIDLAQNKVVPGKYIEFNATRAYGPFKPGPFKVPVNSKLRLLMNWSGPYFETFFHINFKQLSYYYAHNEIKKNLSKRNLKISELTYIKKEMEELMIRENWVPPEDAQTIANNLTLAAFIEKNLSISLDTLQAKLSPHFEDETTAHVYDALHLAHHLQQHSNKTDIDYVLKNLSSPDYLTFRDDLFSSKSYPSISSEHQKEIARNVLAFKGQNRIAEVSPLYFPPCLKNHVNGNWQDISPTMLKDKIFMIGLEGEGTIDLNPQPYEESCAMVALHANAINTFLTRQFLTFPNAINAILITLILSILIGIITQNVNHFISLPATLACIAAFIYYSFYSFSENRTQVETIYPISAIIMTYLINTGLQLFLAYREKQKVKGMFGKMVSPDVLKVMSEDPDLFSLTGKRQACTSYFSSMENFPEITKGVTPQEMTGLLSDYLTPASQIITSYSGYIDKYEGHIIMADFGVPIKSDDHMMQCLYASIEQQVDMQAFQNYIQARFGKEVNTSMGVNTGFVSAGNMGSDRKMQYTIMGDTVNTAARFRPANWIYDKLGSIIIGEMTYPLVQDAIEVRVLDKLLLKGKLKPVTIYEVMGWNPTSYLETRGKIDVTETLKICWAKHCPPEKIYGYYQLWELQIERTGHPMAKELKEFFQSQLPTSAQLTELILKHQIVSNYRNYLALGEEYSNITQNQLPQLQDSNWKEKLKHWQNGLEDALDVLTEKHNNDVLAEKCHRDLSEVLEKIEALYERLELNITLNDALDLTWDKLRDYVSSGFQNDQSDYLEQYNEVYSKYESAASAFIDTISPRMDEYHQLMSKVGSRTEDQIKGSEVYEKGLELQWQRKWEEAKEAFQQALGYMPGDRASLSFIRRMDDYIKTPPKEDWQGEFKQTKK